MADKSTKDLRREIEDLREEAEAEESDYVTVSGPSGEERTVMSAEVMIEAMREARDPDYEPDPGEPGDPIPEGMPKAMADGLREIRRHHASDGDGVTDPRGGGDPA